jgi:hypothetical protein
MAPSGVGFSQGISADAELRGAQNQVPHCAPEFLSFKSRSRTAAIAISEHKENKSFEDLLTVEEYVPYF